MLFRSQENSRISWSIFSSRFIYIVVSHFIDGKTNKPPTAVGCEWKDFWSIKILSIRFSRRCCHSHCVHLVWSCETLPSRVWLCNRWPNGLLGFWSEALRDWRWHQSRTPCPPLRRGSGADGSWRAPSGSGKGQLRLRIFPIPTSPLVYKYTSRGVMVTRLSYWLEKWKMAGSPPGKLASFSCDSSINYDNNILPES